MADLVLVNHPLVQAKLARLRDVATLPTEFRRLLRETAALMFFSVTSDLETVATTVQTPLAPCVARRLARPLVLAPILRAGLGLLEGIHDLVPEAVVAHLGIYRDEHTLQPQSYYARIPADLTNAEILLLDPMLATGRSAGAAMDQLKARGAARLRFLCLVACPEGVEYLQTTHPDVPIHTASVDERLNERGYIVPGLGDAGDRFFGT